jgi:hypothetical protein
MTGQGASPGEMPKTPVPGRAEPELDEQVLEAMLAGQHLPHDAPEQAHVVAEMLSSLAGPADPGDLAAEPAVRMAFARAASAAAPASSALGARPAAHRHRRGRRRWSWPPIGLSARLAATLAAVLVMLGGTVAAYAGVLPGPIQTLAHRAIGAPAPRAVPAGPGLCQAYEQAENGHDPRALAGAFARLARAAGSVSNVIPFCIEAGQPVVPTARTDGGVAGPPGPAPTSPPGRGKHHGRAKGKSKSKGKSHGKAKGHSKGKAKGKAKGHGKAKKQKKVKKHKKHKKAKKAKKAKHHKKAKKHHKPKHHGRARGHHKARKHRQHKKGRKQKR